MRDLSPIPWPLRRNSNLRLKSEFTGDRHEAVIDPSAKYKNTEVAGGMIEQHSPRPPEFVAFPARHAVPSGSDSA